MIQNRPFLFYARAAAEKSFFVFAVLYKGIQLKRGEQNQKRAETAVEHPRADSLRNTAAQNAERHRRYD